MAQAKMDDFTAPLIPLSIRVLACNRVTLTAWDHENLSSPFWRIYWNGSRGWFITFGGRTTALDPGSVIVIPPFTAFRAHSEKSATQFYIHFDIESTIAPFKSGIYQFPITESIKSAMVNMTGDAAPEQALLNTIKANFLCCYYLRRLPEESMGRVHYSRPIMAAMGIMARNMEKPFSNPALARAAGMNVNSFIRLFQKEAGVPPQKWYLEKRINRASLLLSHTNKSIDEIAGETGFCDRAHFSRVFGKLKNTGPAQYRRQREHS